MIRRIPPYLPTLLVLSAICYLSLDADPLSGKERWLDFPGSDKLVHFIMYAGLTATYCFDYYRRRITRHHYWPLVVALLAAIGVGAVLECMQAYMGIGRSGDYIDFVANSLGAIAGILAGNKLFARLMQK